MSVCPVPGARQANYHEMMAHVPVHALQLSAAAGAMPVRPLRALILGGGDGGVAARLLEHEPDVVGSVTLVEIDPLVVETCRRFFGFSQAVLPPVPTQRAAGAGSAGGDGRLRLVVADGTAWVSGQQQRQPPLPETERYDIVVVDSTDFSLGSSWTRQVYTALADNLMAPVRYTPSQYSLPCTRQTLRALARARVSIWAFQNLMMMMIRPA
eukprot:SAG22_NODE_6930_length_794_cov_1.227338_1_plen_210_part_10